MMDFTLQKVTQSERQILWNLLQFMVFETSIYGKNDIQDDGTFSYKYFDKYFTDEGRIAFLIRDKDNHLLGFVMINQYLQKVKNGHAIAEFMILPRSRRQGIGRAVAKRCFALFPGNWEVQPARGSESAYKFWKSIIDEFTGDDNQAKDGIFVFRSNCAPTLTHGYCAFQESPEATAEDEDARHPRRRDGATPCPEKGNIHVKKSREKLL